MNDITAKTSRKMKKYAVLTRESRCFLGSFAFSWEQRKLEDILQTLPFKAYLKIPEQDGKYEIIQQGNDPIIGYASGEPCKDYENTVIFGDHTLSLYKPRSPFFVATDGVRIIKGFDNMDGNYLLSLLERNKPQSEGYKRYYSILAGIDVFFTENHEEQSKIGEYFSRIDHLITLHQRKCVFLCKSFLTGILIKSAFSTFFENSVRFKMLLTALIICVSLLLQIFEFTEKHRIMVQTGYRIMWTDLRTMRTLQHFLSILHENLLPSLQKILQQV